MAPRTMAKLISRALVIAAILGGCSDEGSTASSGVGGGTGGGGTGGAGSGGGPRNCSPLDSCKAYQGCMQTNCGTKQAAYESACAQALACKAACACSDLTCEYNCLSLRTKECDSAQ